MEIASYLGRDDIKFEIKENGYLITRGGRPAMHLSDGERASIALIYFLKSLADTSFNLKTGIVVIDDPVSSLDTNSLYCAFGYIKDRTRGSGQLFILTHNFSLFRQVKNWFNHEEGKGRDKKYNPSKNKKCHFYMLNTCLISGLRSGQIDTVDPLLHEYESEYHYLFHLVKKASGCEPPKTLAEVYPMPNVARRLFEAFLAFRVPGKAGDLHSQIYQLTGDSAKKSRVLRFLHTHSHAEHIDEFEHDLSMLAETPAVLSDMLELMRLNDEGHYDAMLEIV